MKIHALEIHDLVSTSTMKSKLKEEVYELLQAIENDDFENIKEEAFDVIQVVRGILHKYDTDMWVANEKHNEKLLSRGHKFID